MPIKIYKGHREYSLSAKLIEYTDGTNQEFPFVDSAYLAIPLDLSNIIIKAARTYADKKRPPQITVVQRPSGGFNIVITDGTKEAHNAIYEQVSAHFGEAGITERFYKKQVIAFPHRPNGNPADAKKRHAGAAAWMKSLLVKFGRRMRGA